MREGRVAGAKDLAKNVVTFHPVRSVGSAAKIVKHTRPVNSVRESLLSYSDFRQERKTARKDGAKQVRYEKFVNRLRAE